MPPTRTRCKASYEFTSSSHQAEIDHRQGDRPRSRQAWQGKVCFGSGQSLPQSRTSVAPARQFKKNHSIRATFHTAWARSVGSLHCSQTSGVGGEADIPTSLNRRDLTEATFGLIGV